MIVLPTPNPHVRLFCLTTVSSVNNIIISIYSQIGSPNCVFSKPCQPIYAN